MSFFDEVGADSIWDSGLDLFHKSAIQTLLQNGNYTLEDLLMEDDFIQETQGQSPNLLEYLTSFYGLQKLIYYLAVPQLPQHQDAAFRFPYMAAEAICCNVNPLLDCFSGRSIESREHLRLLFSFVQPQLLQRLEYYISDEILQESTTAVPKGTIDPFLESQGFTNIQPNDIRPYMAGYFAKVVAYLCKKRPATIVRFLDRTPGIAKGLVRPTALSTAAIAALINTILDLPWYPSLGMGTLRLSSNDPSNESLPKLLLLNISDALDTAIRSLTTHTLPTHTMASAAAHAADIIVNALHAARSAAPHEKFGVETYNAERLERTRRGAIANSNSNGSNPHDESMNDANAINSDPLSSENVHLDPSFHLPTPTNKDRANLRLLKMLRDGDCVDDVLRIVTKAGQCLQMHQEHNSIHASGAAVTGTIQTICDAAFRVLSSILEACAFGYKHQVLLAYQTENSNGNDHGNAVRVPRIIEALAQQGTESLIQYLSSLSSSAGCTVQDILNATSLDSLPSSLSSSSSSHPHNSNHPTQQHTKKRAPLANEDIVPGYAPPPSYRLAPSLGLAGLSLTKLFAHFTRCGGWNEACTTIGKYNIYSVLLDTMEAFPWHSILHRTVTDAIIDTVRDGTPTLHRYLFFDGRLLTRIVETCKLARLPISIQHYGKRTGRIGYVGHMQSIANAIISMYEQNKFSTVPLTNVKNTTTNHSSSSIHSLLSSHSGFWSVVYNELTIANIAHGVLIGGMAPDTKASGNVGAAADATGAAPRSNTAVDEVPANVDGPDVEDRLSAGSGGSDDEDRQHFSHDEENEDGRDGGSRNPYLSDDDEDKNDEGEAGGSGDKDSDNDSEEKFQFHDGEAIGADEFGFDGSSTHNNTGSTAKDEAPVYNAFVANDEDDEEEPEVRNNVTEWAIPVTTSTITVTTNHGALSDTMDDFASFGSVSASTPAAVDLEFDFPVVSPSTNFSQTSTLSNINNAGSNDDFGFDAFGSSVAATTTSSTTDATVTNDIASFDFDFAGETSTKGFDASTGNEITNGIPSGPRKEKDNSAFGSTATETSASPSFTTEASDFGSFNIVDYGNGPDDISTNRSSSSSSLTSTNEGQLVGFDDGSSDGKDKGVSGSPTEAFSSQLDDDEEEEEEEGNHFVTKEGTVAVVPELPPRRLSISKVPVTKEATDAFSSTTTTTTNVTNSSKSALTTNDDAFSSFNDDVFGTQLPSNETDPAFAGFTTPDPTFGEFSTPTGNTTSTDGIATSLHKPTSSFGTNGFDDFTF